MNFKGVYKIVNPVSGKAPQNSKLALYGAKQRAQTKQLYQHTVQQVKQPLVVHMPCEVGQMAQITTHRILWR